MIPVGFDWDSAVEAARRHELAPYMLSHVPRELWDVRRHLARHSRPIPYASLAHAAAAEGDVAALVLLIKARVDLIVDKDVLQVTPASEACHYGRARALALLLATPGAVPHKLRHWALRVALKRAYERVQGADDCVRLLLANGMRIEERMLGIQNVVPWMRAFDSSVARCRQATVALLGIKRRRVPSLAQFDKFLVREVALQVWLTRGDDRWVDRKVLRALKALR